MKKENRSKAFTLVELLGVVVVLAILALVIVPSIVQYMNKGKDEYNKALKEQLVIAGKNYYAENKSELPVETGDSKYVALGILQSNDLISKDFKDADGFSCKDSYVTVSKDDDGKVSYHGCLICKNESGVVSYDDKDDKYCNLTNSSSSETSCKLKYDSINNKIKFENKLPGAKYIISTTEIEPDELENKPELTEMQNPELGQKYYGYVVNENGEVGYCYITPTRPKVDKLTCKFTKQPELNETIQNTTEFQLTCSGDAISTAKADSDKINSVNKLGEITNFTETTQYTEEEEEIQERTFTFDYEPNQSADGKDMIKVETGFLIDENDNNDKTQEITSNEFNVDAKVPQIRFTATADNKTKDGWYKAPVTVKATCTSPDDVRIKEFYVGTDKVKTSGTSASWNKTETSGSKTKQYTANCTDENNKTGTGNGKFGIDSTDPKITFKLNKNKTSDGWYKAPLTITVKCTDTGSGVKSLTADSEKGTKEVIITLKKAANPKKITATCKDKVGHSTSVTKSYKIKVYSQSSSCSCKTNKTCTSLDCCGCKTYNYTTKYNYYWSGSTTVNGSKSSGTSGCTKASQVGKIKVTSTKTTKTCTKCVKAGGSINTSPPCSYPQNNTCGGYKTKTKTTYKTCKRSSYQAKGSCKTKNTCSKSCCGCKERNSCWHY